MHALPGVIRLVQHIPFRAKKCATTIEAFSCGGNNDHGQLRFASPQGENIGYGSLEGLPGVVATIGLRGFAVSVWRNKELSTGRHKRLGNVRKAALRAYHHTDANTGEGVGCTLLPEVDGTLWSLPPRLAMDTHRAVRGTQDVRAEELLFYSLTGPDSD